MKRNTDIGNNLNIVKDKIRYYREKNNYFYQKLSDLLMLYGIRYSQARDLQNRKRDKNCC